MIKRGVVMDDDKQVNEGSEEYEILPHKEIQRLRSQLNDVRGNVSPESNLQSSIDRLARSMNSMMSLFRAAEEDLKIEEHDTDSFQKQIGPMMARLDQISDQNEKIAEGIISLVELLKNNEIKMEQQIKETVYKIPDLIDKRDKMPKADDFLAQMPPDSVGSFGQQNFQSQAQPFGKQPSYAPPPQQNYGQQFANHHKKPLFGSQQSYPQQGLNQGQYPSQNQFQSMNPPASFQQGSSFMAAPPEPPKKKKGLFG